MISKIFNPNNTNNPIKKQNPSKFQLLYRSIINNKDPLKGSRKLGVIESGEV